MGSYDTKYYKKYIVIEHTEKKNYYAQTKYILSCVLL